MAPHHERQPGVGLCSANRASTHCSTASGAGAAVNHSRPSSPSADGRAISETCSRRKRFQRHPAVSGQDDRFDEPAHATRATVDHAATMAQTDSSGRHEPRPRRRKGRNPRTPAGTRRAGSTTPSAPRAAPKWPARQTDASRADSPRADIAPATISVERQQHDELTHAEAGRRRVDRLPTHPADRTDAAAVRGQPRQPCAHPE